jgi:hypothetical protein
MLCDKHHVCQKLLKRNKCLGTWPDFGLGVSCSITGPSVFSNRYFFLIKSKYWVFSTKKKKKNTRDLDYSIPDIFF